jgi:hypothetical protein
MMIHALKKEKLKSEDFETCFNSFAKKKGR